MKKFLIAAALMFAVPAQAQLSEEVCVTLGDYAGAVMKVRQAGGTKARVLGIIDTTDTITYRLMLATVNFVYAVPLNTSYLEVDEMATNKCLEVLHNDRYPANT